MQQNPQITVVIATRNRAPSLGRLLRCIKGQDLQDFECHVIDDGSSRETVDAYRALWEELDDRFQLHKREDRQPGGPSRARNRGIALARARYIAFCDDDDQWIRHDHLSTAVRAMTANNADLFFAGMQTAAHDKVVDPDLYAPARAALQEHLLQGEMDLYMVSPQNMLTLLRHRTLHTDTIVASRALLYEAGLYWEKSNLAEDRDLSFRMADKAQKILFRSTTVGELDVSHHVSLYRTFAHREKALFAYMTTLHSEIAVRNPKIRRLARANRAWDLLDLSRVAVEDGRTQHAREFAIQSFLLHPTMSALRLYAGTWMGKTSFQS